jgi:hypothetical protein
MLRNKQMGIKKAPPGEKLKIVKAPSSILPCIRGVGIGTVSGVAAQDRLPGFIGPFPPPFWIRVPDMLLSSLIYPPLH